MKNQLGKFLVGLLLAYASSAANANIIVNGGFENGLTGWTCTNSNLCATNGNGNPGSALYGFTNTGYASLFQNVSTVVGGIYSLTFDTMAGDSRNEIGYSVNGFSNVKWTSSGYTWVSQSASFTATSALTKIEFFLATDPGTGTYQLDNVAVNQTGSAVPEPGSIALLGLALAGVAAARRKKQA